MLLDQFRVLTTAGSQHNRVPGAIVQHRERITAACVSGDMALEIHLPQLVGRFALKALVLPWEPSSAAQAFVPSQDLSDRRGARNVAEALVLQDTPQLASSPAGVLVTHRKNERLDSR